MTERLRVHDFRKSPNSPFVVLFHPADVLGVRSAHEARGGYEAHSRYCPKGNAYLSDSSELVAAYIADKLRGMKP